MSRPKKDAAKQMADEATVAFAHAQVEADPRGAPEVLPASEVPDRTPCALESAPVGSKCVVSRTEDGKAVRLLNAASVETLGTDDLFYTLPAGAKVRKAAPDRYEVYRLGVQEAPLAVVASAREAVASFLKAIA